MSWTFALPIVIAAAVDAGGDQPRTVHPAIADHGGVVPFPEAAAQPRDGSKICVDLTSGGEADRLNPAVEKLARYVNIYAGAGARPAKARITVVLHGKATTVALDDAAYAKRFSTKANPNLPLIRKLRKAGVEFLVCGQSLSAHKFRPGDVSREIRVAVSALTVNVNRQQDGYAFIPLH